MKLTVYDIEKIDDLAFKKTKENLTKSSSIMEIFTDFEKVPPMIIEEDASALNTREIMKREHLRMKIVISSDEHFKGILPLAKLTDAHITQRVLEGFERDSLLVRHCMIEKANLHALDYEEITTATIGDVLEALKHIGSSYCLVVNHGTHQIRGVISANDISHALHMPIDITNTGIGTSFMDIVMRLNHSL